MASLRQKLKISGGGLAQTSQEELQALSSAAGRPAPPTSPMESSVIGATPDQAKMAGTPVQKANALRIGAEGQASLRDTLRTTQARSTQTTEEAQASQSASRLKQLQGLQARTQEVAKGLGQQAAATQADTQLRLQQEVQDPAVQAALEAFRANPKDPQTALAVNQALGRTTVESMLSNDEIMANYVTAAEQAGQLTAEAFQDSVAVTDIDPTQLGFADINELASILGLDPNELGGMSVGDMIDSAQAQIEDEYTKVSDLEAKANNPNIGAAERAEARKQLKDLGAVGVRSVETDVDRLADQIENADVVKFGGEEIQIDEMLDNEYLSGLAARYLGADEDDPFRKQLEENEPELTAWIKQNDTVLRNAIGDLEEGVTDFAELQYRNQAMAEPAPGVGKTVPSAQMAEIIPGWGTLQSEEYNLDEYPAIKIINDPEYKDKQAQINVREALNVVKDITGFSKELGTMTEYQLRDLGITKNSDKWKTTQAYLNQYQAAQTIDPDDLVSVIDTTFGMPVAEAQSTVKGTKTMFNSGLFPEVNQDSMNKLQPFSDGFNLKSSQEIAGNLKSLLGEPPRSLTDSISSTPTAWDQEMQKLNALSKGTGVDPQAFKVYSKISYAFEDDGKLGKRAAADKNLSMEDIEYLFDKLPEQKLPRESVKIFQGRANEAMSGHIDNTILAITGFNLKESLDPETYTTRRDASGKIVARAQPLIQEVEHATNAIEALSKLKGDTNGSLQKHAIQLQINALKKVLRIVRNPAPMFVPKAKDPVFDVPSADREEKMVGQAQI